jgi:selenocysteine lyase/cysteine desulfurase
MIPCQRHLFDIPDEVAFFNFSTLAPILKSSRAAGLAGVERKAQPWNVGRAERVEEPERARALFANLIGATPQDVAIVPAASYGIATAVANLEVGAGQRIVVLEDQYPNNVLPWVQRCQSVGAELVFVRRPEDDDLTNAVLMAIDDRTAIAALPHCFWTDGTLLDLSLIGRRCREVGAALVVDATQSTGAVPIDVAEVRPDFFIASAYKWLLCPYTMGFLYVAPQHQGGVPLEHSWRGGMIEGWDVDWNDGIMRYPESWQPGTGRFNMGESDNIISIPMTIVALKQIEDWGVREINSSLRRITETIIERTHELGLVAPTAEQRAGHMTGLRLVDSTRPNGLKDVQERLAARKVYISVRGDVIRIAPHLSVTDDDIDRLIMELAAVL